MSETPRHISLKVDQTLDYLNATWDLQLPRLYRTEADAATYDLLSIARRCSSRIRYLCCHNVESIDHGIAEFEEDAKTIYSCWVWKPSQEKNTIPSSSRDESLLKRDILICRKQPVSNDLREQLLLKLVGILDDEYTLARESDSYERTASRNNSMPATRHTSFVSALEVQGSSSTRGPSSTHHDDLSTSVALKRRSKALDNDLDSKRFRIGDGTDSKHKNQLPLDVMFSKSKSSAQSYKCASTSRVPSAEIPPTSATKDRRSGDHIMNSFNTIATEHSSVFSVSTGNSSFTSATESLHSSPAESTQDLLPTQDALDALEDISLMIDLEATEKLPQQTVFDIRNAAASNPFQPLQQLPANISFWLRWEIYRVAQHTALSPLILYESITEHSDSEYVPYERVWTILDTVCKKYNTLLPVKSDIRPWMEKSNSYGSSDGKTAYFTFDFQLNTSPDSDLWKLVLNPVKVDIGNRLHRKFGADRHMTGFITYFDSTSLPKWITSKARFDADIAFKQLGSWLATDIHHIAGRQWRSFYLEPDTRRTKRAVSDTPRLKLNMFAVDGIDFSCKSQQSFGIHQPMSIEELINWHIPISDNIESTNLKLFSRFGLALSKTKKTVILDPSQFRYRRDTEPLMDDGCALMSMGMARAVWKICGDGSNDIPSAFQGRIGGAKGLWVIDYRHSMISNNEDIWIEVSDSQLKIKPHPREKMDADETQRTFEVLKWSSPCTPGHLNMQLINILADRGVSRLALRQAVLNDIGEYIDASRGAMKDSRLLQGWLQDYHTSDRHSSSVTFEHGLPDSEEEQVSFLVQSGLTAENCVFLRQRIISLMTHRLNTYVDKLRVELPHSTSVFCVPDPYQALEEDEVYLGFSAHWENPRTGFKETSLHDIDVLVARNPAALASDIQKRRAVYKHALRNFKDVIVFPTKGKAPLASLLSGGDYDGDTVTVIWDSDLVNCFNNSDKPNLPTEQQCGLSKVATKLSDVVHNSPPTSQEIDDFLISCILFNAQPTRLGICTTEHEKLIYSGAHLSEQGPIILAALAGYLVDANKQGLLQTKESWSIVRKWALGGRKLLPLAYKTGQDLPRRGDHDECVNIIDYLKFDVAMKRKEDTLIEFENMLSNAHNFDIDLCMPCRQEETRSKDRGYMDWESTARVLEDLKIKLNEAYTEWMRRCSKRGRGVEMAISTDIRFVSRMLQEIIPLEHDCDLYRNYQREKSEMNRANGPCGNRHLKGSQWSLLRASMFYKLFHRSNIVWWTVGDELSRIKARSIGATREITPAMHYLLKADGKRIKRLVGEDQIDDHEYGIDE